MRAGQTHTWLMPLANSYLFDFLCDRLIGDLFAYLLLDLHFWLCCNFIYGMYACETLGMQWDKLWAIIIICIEFWFCYAISHRIVIRVLHFILHLYISFCLLV